MAKTVSKLGEEGKVSIRYESGMCMATVTPQPYRSGESSKSSLETTVWYAEQAWDSSMNISGSVTPAGHYMSSTSRRPAVVGIST